MPNALSTVGEPRPAPNPKPSQIHQSNALNYTPGPPPAPDMPDRPRGNAIASPQMPTGASAAPVLPAPSHEQTVAALRHFGAIKRELIGLLKDPDLGKSDIRSKAIDGAVKLVANGIIKATDAVMQLGTFPDRPYDQKKWVEQNFAQTIQAANAVLDHHRIANAGIPDASDNGDPDDHQNHIASLMAQYKGAGNA